MLPIILLLSKLKVRALVDSGNTLGDAISQQQYDKLPENEKELVPAEVTKVGTAGKGGVLRVLGRLKHPIPFRIQGHPTKFFFRPNLVPQLAHPVNLGWSWLKSNDVVIRPGDNAILVKDREVPAPRVMPFQPEVADLYVANEKLLPPQSVSWLEVRPKLNREGDPLHDLEGDFIVEGCARFNASTTTVPWVAALARAHKGLLSVEVLNPHPFQQRIKTGIRYGLATRLSSVSSPSKAPESICTLESQDLPKTQVRSLAQKTALIRKVLRMAEWNAIPDEADRAKAVALVVRHFDLFAFDGEYGRTDVLEHRIELVPGTKPHRARAREFNPAVEDALVKQVEDWLKKDVVYPCTSEWNSALVPVCKGQKIRFCLDFRPLNRVTVKDSMSIGETQAKLAKLGGSKIFSVVDGSGAFLQVPIAEESQKLTAFTTRSGVYAFRRMPFGLCNAPSTYGRLVAQVLGHLPWTQAISFVDDTIIHSQNFAEHLHSLDLVFQAFTKAGLKLGPEKCELFRTNVKFLGHRISADGVHMLPEYVRVVSEWPLPKTRKQVRQFYGKLSYYRRFIRGFQHLAGPLTAVLKQDGTKDDAEFTPTQDFIEAFGKLKAALTEAPILGFPDFKSEEPFILDTDFSVENRAVGGALSQKQGGVERPLAFSSIKMSPAQANYSPHKGELAGVIIMLDKFKYFLFGRRFRLRVDAAALKWIKSCEPPKGLTARWLSLLADYDFDVEWRAGKSHGNADALSRAPHAEENPALTDKLDDSVLVGALSIATDAQALEGAVDQLLQQQAEDPDLQAVSKLLRGEEAAGSQHEKTMSPAACRLWEMKADLFIDNKGLMRIRRLLPHDPLQRVVKAVIVPKSQQEEIVRRMHEQLGHRGRQETIRRIFNFFYFSGVYELTKEVLSKCLVCAQKGRQQPPHRGHLHSHQASYPFQLLSLDFIGPINPTSGGCAYIVTCLDVFSRWLEAKAVPTCTSKDVIDFLAKDVFPRYSLPERIHTDNGSHFTSSAFSQFLSGLKIQHSRTPSYNPRSNPVERAHQTLMRMVTRMANSNPKAWKDLLPAALFAMRTSVHATTNLAPYEVVFGRGANMELDQLFRLPGQQFDASDAPGSDLRRTILEAHEYARQHSARSVIRSRRNYLGDHRSFEIGDLVWLFTPRLQPGRGKKFSNFYSGPWQVIKRLNKVCYKLSPRANWLRRDQPVATIDRIKPFVCSEEDNLDDLSIPPPQGLDLNMPEDEDATQFEYDSAYEHEDTDVANTPRNAESEPAPMSTGALGGNPANRAEDPNPAALVANEQEPVLEDALYGGAGGQEALRDPAPSLRGSAPDLHPDEPLSSEASSVPPASTPAPPPPPPAAAPAGHRARLNEAQRLAADAARFGLPENGPRIRAPCRLLQNDFELGSWGLSDDHGQSHSEYLPPNDSLNSETLSSNSSSFP